MVLWKARCPSRTSWLSRGASSARSLKPQRCPQAGGQVPAAARDNPTRQDSSVTKAATGRSIPCFAFSSDPRTHTPCSEKHSLDARGRTKGDAVQAGIPRSVRRTALPKDSPSHPEHTRQVDYFCCCFHFYLLCYRSVINGLSFTRQGMREITSLPAFPISEGKGGYPFSFHSFLFFLFIYVRFTSPCQL